jgi:hypothetical protein
LAEVGDVPDFHVVDLFAREELYGSLKDLAEDPYLFWPVPLRYRTWIYHDMYRNRRCATGKATRGASGSRSQKAASLDEIGTLRDVMGQFCIDVVWGFQPAAVRWYAPLALVCPLTADRSLTYFAVFVLLFCYAAAKFMNQMSLYEMTRIVSLPLRLVFMVAVCVRIDSRSFVYMFGSMFVLILCVMDVFFGDLKQLAAYRLHCSYEVIRTFPNRVCLFRRKGANFANMEYPVRVHEDVTGMGAWEPGFVLIADIYGILFELRPMTAENWRALHDARNEETPVFVGLDLYWEEEPVCPPLENIGGPATSWLPPQVREGPRPPQGPQHILQETDL